MEFPETGIRDKRPKLPDVCEIVLKTAKTVIKVESFEKVKCRKPVYKERKNMKKTSRITNRKKQKKLWRAGRGILPFLAMLCLAAAGACALFAFWEIRPELELDREYQELRELAVRGMGEKDGRQGNTQAKEGNGNQAEASGRQIDFEILQKINPDIVGWIFVPGTKIDYPVLLGEDLEHYLDHGYDGSYNRLGSIFAHPGVREGLGGPHVFLFGHRMKSGQMFAQLQKFEERSFADSHPVYLYTPKGMREYRTFAFYECRKESGTFRLMQEAGDLPGYLVQVEREAEYFVPDVLESNGNERVQILTLSTCPGRNSGQNRLVVQCIGIGWIETDNVFEKP